MNKLVFVSIMLLMLSSCNTKPPIPSEPNGMGMGNNGMMARHHTKVPSEYAGRTNPVAADEASLSRGNVLYTQNCATCHGEGGMGDGPAGAAFDPAPAPVAHTSQMMADDYLFWRISEGGAAFKSSMPAWNSLEEQSRWDAINYMRALGAGTVQPQKSNEGGAIYGPALQATQQADMLAQAVEKKVITRDEADTFAFVHDAVEKYRAEHPEIMKNGQDATERENSMLEALVKAQTITQKQADAFRVIHDRIGAAGLMK